MTARSAPPDAAGDRGYVSSLAPRPHPLTPAGPPRNRWGELTAAVAWIVGSWLRPADADAVWEQRAGREETPS